MLEAVNSVLQSAPIVRVNAEQSSTLDSFAVNPDRVQKVSQAPYLSPYFSIDAVDSQVVLQIRDPQTGKVLQSYPSETNLQTAPHNLVKDAPAFLPQTAASGADTAVQAQSVPAQAQAQPQPVKTPAPAAPQIAALASAAYAGKSSGASISVLA